MNLNEFFKQKETSLKKICFFALAKKDKQETDEIYQTACLKLLERAEKEKINNPFNLMRFIIKCVVVDFYRKKSNWNALFISGIDVENCSEEKSAEEEAEQNRNLSSLLNKILRVKNEMHKTFLIRRLVYGESIKEIAKDMQTTESAISNCIYVFKKECL